MPVSKDNPSAYTSNDIIDALLKKFPAKTHLAIREASSDHQRMTNKIDLLVIHQWGSRNHERHAIEIKISYSDWRKELDRPEKASWWLRHAHRFSIAAPLALAKRIAAEVPPGWGVLGITQGGVTTVVGHPPTKPAEIGMQTFIGLMRGLVDAGPLVLQRENQAGYQRGFADAKAIVEGDTGITVEEFQRLKREHQLATDEATRLRTAIREFEQESGIRVSAGAQARAEGKRIKTARDFLEQLETRQRTITPLILQVSNLLDAAQLVNRMVTETVTKPAPEPLEPSARIAPDHRLHHQAPSSSALHGWSPSPAAIDAFMHEHPTATRQVARDTLYQQELQRDRESVSPRPG